LKVKDNKVKNCTRYGEGSAGFYDYLWSVHQQYPQYPIWVTEFADTSSNVTGKFNSTLKYGSASSHHFQMFWTL